MPYDNFECLHLRKLKKLLKSTLNEKTPEEIKEEPRIKTSGFVLNVPVSNKSGSQGSGSQEAGCSKEGGNVEEKPQPNKKKNGFT